MDSIVSTILGTIDGVILNTGQTLFNSTVILIRNFVYIMLTVSIVWMGTSIALGIMTIRMKEAVQIIIRFVFVLLFGLTWSNFETIYVAATDGSQAIALGFFAPFTGGTSEPTATAALDKFGGQMAATTDNVAKAVSSYFRALIAFMLNAILALVLAAYVIVVGASKIVIAFLLGVAPFAILCTVFEKTKNLFEGWLTTLVANLMYPIVAAGIVGTIVTAAVTIFTRGDDSSTLGDFMTFIVLMLAGAMAILKIPSIAQGLTGSFGIAGFSPRPLATAGTAMGKALGMTYTGRQLANKIADTKEKHSRSRKADFDRYGATRDEHRQVQSRARAAELMRKAHERKRLRAEWRKPGNK